MILNVTVTDFSYYASHWSGKNKRMINEQTRTILESFWYGENA